MASYESLQDPGIPIPLESMKIHEITDDDVKGHSINWNEVDDIFKVSQLIVAHNAGFDRPFIEKHSMVSQKKYGRAALMILIGWNADLKIRSRNFFAYGMAFIMVRIEL